MSCQAPETILNLLASITALRRPKLLLRTARFGLELYNRERDLRRILRLPAAPASGEALVRQLMELEALQEAQRQRRMGAGPAGAEGSEATQILGYSWRAERHVEILTALLAELKLVVEIVPPAWAPREPTELAP